METSVGRMHVLPSPALGQFRAATGEYLGVVDNASQTTKDSWRRPIEHAKIATAVEYVFVP